MPTLNISKTTPTTVTEEVIDFRSRTKDFFNTCQVRLDKGANLATDQVSVEEVWMNLEVKVDINPTMGTMGVGIM